MIFCPFSSKNSRRSGEEPRREKRGSRIGSGFEMNPFFMNAGAPSSTDGRPGRNGAPPTRRPAPFATGSDTRAIGRAGLRGLRATHDCVATAEPLGNDPTTDGADRDFKESRCARPPSRWVQDEPMYSCEGLS